MITVLVLYYSSYGHVERKAESVAKGVGDVQDVKVAIKRVPELVPEEVAKKSDFKLDQPAPIVPSDASACESKSAPTGSE